MVGNMSGEHQKHHKRALLIKLRVANFKYKCLNCQRIFPTTLQSSNLIIAHGQMADPRIAEDSRSRAGFYTGQKRLVQLLSFGAVRLSRASLRVNSTARSATGQRTYLRETTSDGINAWYSSNKLEDENYP